MGAAAPDIPGIAGRRPDDDRSRWQGQRLGACTDCRRYWTEFRAGEIDAEEIDEVEDNLATTAGTCAVMGTASTMSSSPRRSA